MRKRLIDFMKFHNKNEHWPNIQESILNSIDDYLKSNNQAPKKMQIISENEEREEYCDCEDDNRSIEEKTYLVCNECNKPL